MSSDAQTFEEIAAIEFIDDAAQQVAVQWPPAMIFKRRPRARPRPKNVHRTEEFPFEAYDESAAAAKVEKTAAVLPKRARPTPKRRTTSETHALALEGPPSIPEPESATEENLFELREEPTRPERLGAFLPQSSAAAQEARDDLAAPGVDAADADQDKARRPEKRRTTDLDLEPPEFDGAARSDEPDVGAGETTVPGDEIADVQRGEPTIAGAEPTIAGAEPTIAGAEPTIAGAEPTIAGAEPTIAGAEPTIAEGELTIVEAQPTIAEADVTIAGAEPSIVEAHRTVTETQRTITEVDVEVEGDERTLAEEGSVPEQSFPELELEMVEVEGDSESEAAPQRQRIEFDADVHFADDDDADAAPEAHFEGPEEDFDLVIDEEPLPAREIGGQRALGRGLGRKEWFEKAFTLDSVLNLRLTTPAETVRRASYFTRLLKATPPATMLDLCCGLGDLSVEFARRGFKVVGLDLSMEVLRHAYSKSKAENLPLQFAHGDMRALDFEEIFDVVVNTDSSFGYFDDLTNFDVLQRIYRCLRPGGRFLLDVLNRDFILQFLPHRAFWKGDQCTVLEEVRFNHVTSQMVNQRAIIFDGGRQKEDTIVIRTYSLHELLNMLANAGFEILSVFGGPRERYFLGQESRQMIIISKKSESSSKDDRR